MLDLTQITNSRILIAALDWGFGHTARTSVLIKQLLAQKNTIVFAGNNPQTDFITKEYPSIEIRHINGYNVTLNSSKNTYFQLLRQFPKIVQAINTERKWVHNITKTTVFDLIIADNRYGFYSNSVPSVILTHQTALQIPVGKLMANFLIKRLINRFSACWIPDSKSHELSGKLSQGKVNIPIHFIGPLSRFNLKTSANYKYHYLFIVSGPEPECYHFLQKSIETIKTYELSAIIACPFDISDLNKNGVIKLCEKPRTKALEELINSSETIVSKSGYTTIMDLIPEKKKTIFIPTKGQYEQVYLSELHARKNESNQIDKVIKNALL